MSVEMIDGVLRDGCKGEGAASLQGRVDSAIRVLEEALSGTSPKSKNTLIKEAIKLLKKES